MFRKPDTVANTEIVKAGYLTKSPPGAAPPMSQWRRRWFVLCDSLRAYPLAERHLRLEYYQNEGDVRKLCDPKGVIDLKNCTRVSGIARLKGHNYVFDICTKERTYHIAAETPTEKYEWMKTLNEILFTPPNGAIEIQDLENAEIQRKKSISRASLERQNSLGDAMERQRPVSCCIYPVIDKKSVNEFSQIGNSPLPPSRQQRPLPPTPDSPHSLTLQPEPQSHKIQLTSHQPLRSTPSLPQSPPPPVPKPRSKNAVENPGNKQSHSASSITSSGLLGDIIIQNPSLDYENIKVVPDYEAIDQPPPVPKPRSRISLEGNNPITSSQSHENNGTPIHSEYDDIQRKNVRLDYEEINVEENATPYEEAVFTGPIHDEGANRILFLNEDVYADPNADPYDHQLESLQASNYEVPVNLLPSPIPPQKHMFHQSTSVLPFRKSSPPLPPPRNRSAVRRDSSIHGSLINLVDEGLYSELQDTNGGQDDEHYGKLMRFTGPVRERRFSDPEIIPISPRSHSSSPLFFSINKSSPPPVPFPYLVHHHSNKPQQPPQQPRHYYENSGYSSVLDKSDYNSPHSSRR